MVALRDSALTLQLCSDCLREVSVLRQELRDALRKLGAPEVARRPEAAAAEKEDAADGRPAAAVTSGAPPPSPRWSEGAGERLRALCVVQDRQLRERLMSSLEGGSLATELGLLGSGAVASAGAELRAGRLRALVLYPSGAVRWDADSAIAAVEADRAGAASSRVFLFPLFSRPCLQLVEVLVHICRRERVLPPLAMLLEALAALLARGAGDREGVACTSGAELFAAVSGALAQPELRARLDTAPGGCVVVRDAPPFGAGGPATAPRFPPYGDGDAPASLGGAISGDVERAVELVAPRLATVQALCGTRAARRVSAEAILRLGAAAAAAAEGPSGPSLFLGLLGALRCPGAASALGLPEDLWRGTPGGALLWALEHLEFAEPAAGRWLPGSAADSGARADTLPMQDPAAGRVPADPGEAEADGAESQGSAEDGGEIDASIVTDERQRTQARFVQCFRDDMLQERPLLMSQVNNLYRMRNSGEALPYKRLGYESLHDFLLEIPGLELHGARNKMEVRIGDPKQFDDFCDEISEGLTLPECSKPQPMPATFLHRVVRVFQHANGQEVSAQSFRNTWNLLFPLEKLQCKPLGYRDLKGLLFNIAFVEKTGTKNNARFCLKQGFDVDSVLRASLPSPSDSSPSPRRAAPTAVAPFSAPPGNWAPASSLQACPQPLDQPASVMTGAMPLGAEQPPGVAQVPGAWPGGAPQRPAAYWPPGGLQMPYGFRRGPWQGDDSSSCAYSASGLADSSRQGSKSSVGSRTEHSMQSQPLGAFYGTPPGGLQMNLPQPPQHQVPRFAGGASSPEGSAVLQRRLRDEEAAASAASAAPYRRPPPLPQQYASSPPCGEDRPRQPTAVKFASTGSPSEGAILSTAKASSMDASAALGRLRGMLPQRGQRLPAGRAVARPLEEPMQVSSATSSLSLGDAASTLGSRGGASRRQEPMQVSSATSSMSLSPTGSPLPPGGLERALAPPGQTGGAPSSMERGALDEVVLPVPRRSGKQRGNTMFISTPGAISCPERDASTMQGRFDLGFVYQERLRTNRTCLIADLASSRVLFTNEACDSLFETLAPLPQRELNDLIFEEDRHNFSASVLYLMIGNFSVMEPQEFRVIAATGVRRATVTGEKLLDSWWWLAFDVCQEERGPVMQ